MPDFFLSPDDLPPGFSYPLAFRILVERGLLNWEPWELLDGESLLDRLGGVRQRYPGRLLVPFARRGDRDDVACWDLDRSHGVISVIDDFAPPGYEQINLLESVSDWLRLVMDDIVDFEK